MVHLQLLRMSRVRWSMRLGGRDHVDVGFVRALGVAEVGHFDQRIDVRIFDVALGVGHRIVRLVSDREIRPVGRDPAERDDMGVELAIELGSGR